MSDFKANIHQIRFLLGLLPKPLTVLPQTLQLYLRRRTYKGGSGRKGRGRICRTNVKLLPTRLITHGLIPSGPKKGLASSQPRPTHENLSL